MTGGNRLGWAFVLPALIFLVIFNVYPLFSNVVLGFTNAELTGGTSKWVGGRNFHRVFSDGKYAAAMRTTALFTVAAVAIELALGFVLALALHRDFKGKTVMLTVLLIPMMLPPAVMGIYWNFLFDGDYGAINQLLHAVGFANPPQ